MSAGESAETDMKPLPGVENLRRKCAEAEARLRHSATRSAQGLCGARRESLMARRVLLVRRQEPNTHEENFLRYGPSH